MRRERVGKYKLKETIGVGSFGKVKRATNTETDGIVAIKIMNKKKLKKQRGLVDLVRQEVAHMKLLPVHDHLITLLEVLESDTHIYLVMECATHGELYQKILLDGPCSEEQGRKYWRQLLEGLDYVHSRKICHRDLKLENLLLDPNDVLKISDFGLSVLRKEYHNHRELMAIAGTPNYIAPEIIAGRGYDGFMADIWSAGVCLYGILAGYLPFDTGKDIKKLFKVISQEDVSYPERFSDDAVDLLTAIFKVNPEERFTLRECIEHPWTNDGYEIDPSYQGSMQEHVQYEPSELEIAEAVLEIKTPSPLAMEGHLYSAESYDGDAYEEDLEALDDLPLVIEHTAPRVDVSPMPLIPAISREYRSPGKSLSENSTHPSNGDLSQRSIHYSPTMGIETPTTGLLVKFWGNDPSLIPSLSHDDQFDDSDAEEIADDVSTDFTDSEEESESSNSGVDSSSGPATHNVFHLLSVANDCAFTSLLSNKEASGDNKKSVVTCFHADLPAAPLLELLASSCRAMDYVRLKVYPLRFLIKVRASPPHQKSVRVNIEIKEAIGSTVVECHRLKGTISNYHEWYDNFMSKYSKLLKKYKRKSKKKTLPLLM